MAIMCLVLLVFLLWGFGSYAHAQKWNPIACGFAAFIILTPVILSLIESVC